MKLVRLAATMFLMFSLSSSAIAADAETDTSAVDAGATDATEDAAGDVIADVGPVSDVPSASDVPPVMDVTEDDTMAGDATSGSDVQVDAPPTSSQFSESECWDEMCPTQINACKADPGCTAIAGCVVDSINAGTQKSSAACADELVQSGVILEADAEASHALYYAIGDECGWSACATTEGSCAGTCTQYLGTDVCNCDEYCWQYMDCCEDICDACGSDFPNECGTACVPQCDGKACGPDGCGGSCGACTPGETCGADGTCGAACTDECTDGESGCDGDVAWICGVTSLGCTGLAEQDCAANGQVCAEGLCVASTGGDADAGTGTGTP